MIAVLGLARTAAVELPVMEVTGIPVADVRLLDGPFRDAQKRDLDYLLTLDPERLLSGMRAAAHLPPKAPLYGGWEKNGSGIVGHYLSACAWMFAATGDPRVKEKMDAVVRGMAECQQNAGNGGLASNAWEADRWYPGLAKGGTTFGNVVPWYVGHKTLAGLRDAWLTGGSEQAKDVLLRYADWCVEITAKMTDAQWAAMTMKEFGAPNEVFADLYALTRKPGYLALAKRFTKEPMLAALARDEGGAINGHHANTQIPLFVGYERVYQVTGETRWHDAARNFWEVVVNRQSFVIGGNSIWESFINPAEYDRKLTEACGPETCNTYNLLKLTKQLHELRPDARYGDYLERALFNHILSSIGPAPDNGFAYYTPVRPGHYKRYSLPFDSFWCCVGSGMENHGRYGAYLYSAAPDRLLVNLYIPSQVRWKERGVEIRQTTAFPADGVVNFAVKAEKPATFEFAVRCPGWSDAAKARLRVNGKDVPPTSQAHGYLGVKREWRDGDTFQVWFPVGPRIETSLGGGYEACFHEPLLLAAPLGTEGLEKKDFYADGSVPFIQLGRKDLDQAKVPAVARGSGTSVLKPDPKNPLRYTLQTTTGSVPLVPFYQVGLERYSVYFPVR
ncbi:glycosyl hydrolase [Luteolibacter sp. LG18]|nr:glycosyl hydrolase [Luteolibacter sp. LG18]